MPIIESEAYVLVRHPLTESSWIVSFFTRSEGVVRGVAKGGRRVKSKFRGALEPMSRVRVELGGREGRDLATVRRVDPLENTIDLYSDWSAASLLMAMAEVLERGLPEKGREEDTYRLIGAIMEQVRREMKPSLAWLYFQIWFLRLHGVLPRPDRCSACGASLGPASLAMDGFRWLCPSCASKSGEKRMTIDGTSFDLLGSILRFPPEAIAARDVSRQSLRPLSKIADLVLEDYLGRPIASSPPNS